MSKQTPTTPEVSIEPLGSILRKWRRDAGLSQVKLANLASCSESTVRLVEKGWTPSEEMLRKLTTALRSVKVTPPRLTADLTCLDCEGFTYTGDIHEGEPDECPICRGPNVVRYVEDAA